MHKYPKLKGKAILSPMVGVNDLAFRQLCEQQGAALVFTEMLPSMSIAKRPEHMERYFKTCPKEKRLAVQLMATNPEEAVAAARKFEGMAHVIDLNVGCPSNNIRKIGAGSALLSDTERLLAIVRAMSESVRLPVSAKMRLGENEGSRNPVQLAKSIEEAGASAIAVHARTVEQGYSGKADWKMIKSVKQALSIPVIGNGDVSSPEKAKAMLEETGCDYVLVGRGALGKPYIFSQINKYLETGKYDDISADPERHIKFFFEYLELAERHKSGFKAVKTHALYFTTGLPHAPRFREALTRCKSTPEIRKAYEEYLKTK